MKHPRFLARFLLYRFLPDRIRDHPVALHFDRLLVRYREPLAVQPHAPVAVIPERFQPELMDAVPLSLFSKYTKPSTSFT